MKTLLSLTIVVFSLFVNTSQAQQEYTVDGKQYTLLAEIEGPLTLLWNSIDGEYRYFSKKGDAILELKNTKINGTYQEEYKEKLRLQSADAAAPVSKLKFTLPGLSSFFVDYNKSVDSNYNHETTAIQLKTRLGAFAGVSNNVYTKNLENDLTPIAGIDFEVTDNINLKRHSVVLRFKQTFEHGDTKFSSQFSLNYRFKFVKTPKFDVFINTKFVAYTYSKKEFTVITPGPADVPIVTVMTESGGNFNAPGVFGLGADYAIGNGYITFNYNDILAVGIDNVDGNFPVDLTLGYKFNL